MAGEVPDQIDLAQPIAPLVGIAELPSDTIRREGGSRGYVLLLASDMSQYYCKGPSLMPGHPYLGVNEWLVSRLARYIGLPSRNAELISWDNELFVGIQILERTMTGALQQSTWSRLRNAPDVAYPLVALDIWTLNSDRHDGNWLGGVLGASEGWFLANDHDMALLPPGRAPTDLTALVHVADGSFIRSAVIREAIRDRAQLDAAVALIRSLSDVELAYPVGQLPEAWIDDAGKRAIHEFLCARRDVLPQIVAAHEAAFPNLV